MKQPATVIKYTASFALAGILLYFSFRGMDWQKFIAVLKECRWIYVLLAMMLGAIAPLIRCLRWQLLLKPVDAEVGLLTCYDAFNVGKISSMVIPHSGELIRCGFVRSQRLPYEKALGTVVLERAWDVLMLFVMMLAVLLCMWGRFGSFFMEKIFEPTVASFSAGDGLSSSLIAGFILAMIIITMLVLKFVRSHAGSVASRALSFVKGIWQGVCTCMKMEGKHLFVLYTILMWLCYLGTSLLVIWALPQNFGLGLIDALFIMLVGAFAGIIPVPGGFGAFHYIVATALLSLYNIPFEMGIIFASLSHESQALTSIILGMVSYFHVLFKRSR